MAVECRTKSKRLDFIRHTYGTLLYKSGTDIFTLQKLLGHASIETTTKIYLHDDIEDLEKNIRWQIDPTDEDSNKKSNTKSSTF